MNEKHALKSVLCAATLYALAGISSSAWAASTCVLDKGVCSTAPIPSVDLVVGVRATVSGSIIPKANIGKLTIREHQAGGKLVPVVTDGFFDNNIGAGLKNYPVPRRGNYSCLIEAKGRGQNVSCTIN